MNVEITRQLFIDRNDIEEQPKVLRSLCNQLNVLPRLKERNNPIVFVAEGSSYNAVGWALPLIKKKNASQALFLYTPEEFLNQLKSADASELTNAILFAVASSGGATALQTCEQAFYKQFPHAPKGYILTNSQSASITINWQYLQPLLLEAGKEVGSIASKSFTLTAYYIHALFLPEELMIELDVLAIGLATFLQSLPQHPSWKPLYEFVATHLGSRPLVLISDEGMLSLLPEIALKFKEAFGTDVSYYHFQEYLKHQKPLAQSEIEGENPENWPLFIYFLPELRDEQIPLLNASYEHVGSVSPQNLQSVCQVWMSANADFVLPSDPELSVPPFQLDNIQKVEMPLHSFIPASLLNLVMMQFLVYFVSAKLDPEFAGELPAEEEPLVIGENTIRTGSCSGCGNCCKDINLVIDKKPIQNIEQYTAIVEKYPEEYSRFVPIGEGKTGILFKCSKLGDDGLCTDYQNRPLLCRVYPSEHSVSNGCKLPKDCTYVFEPLSRLTEIMEERALQGQKLPEFITSMKDELSQRFSMLSVPTTGEEGEESEASQEA